MSSESPESHWFSLLSQGSLDEVSSFLQSSNSVASFLSLQVPETHQHCLFYAVSREDSVLGDQLLTFLLSQGAPAGLKDHLNQTPLFFAACKGHLNQIRVLLQAGNEPNWKDVYQQTAIYYAAREGHLEAISLLRSAGAEVNVGDHQGQTPLHYASRQGQMDAVKLLIDMGANAECKDSYRQTPRKWAENAGFTALATFLSRIEMNLKEKRAQKSAKKIKAALMKVDENGQKSPVTAAELTEFEAKYPEIARFWQSEEGLEALSELDCDAILEERRPWERRGKILMTNLWKSEGAYLFHEPVDPIKLNLPDYFQIIKKPMDLGTIKRKLFNNAYDSGEAMLKDFSLMFDNCRLYNQGVTEVLSICAKVEDSYKTQAELLGLMKLIGQD